MAKEISFLQVRMSVKLKEQFRQLCAEDEIDMSDKVREIIANLVRSRARQSGKPTDEQLVKASKSNK